MKIRIADLMTSSGVAFGTSGARGLVTAMTDCVCFAYTLGFLQYLERAEKLPLNARVAVAGDLRPSTGRIMEAVCRAAAAKGFSVENCGRVPSPALALYGLENQIPTIMVTGSHIPDDRNGIKFNKATGEILKADERGMSAQIVDIEDTLFHHDGAFLESPPTVRQESPTANENYIARYLNFFGCEALKGLRIGVYQHSAVGRDVLMRILSGLGAEVVPLGRSDKFIPVDTEAIRTEDVQLAQEWARQGRFDAIVSADGDSDRPLVSDERGHWLRGDVAGILCAHFLGADTVCTPVSCNTAVEKCGWFREVRRTRIGSPYVIEAMHQASASGAPCVVGYEANGGFLLNSDLERNSRRLRALPTRDAVIVIVAVLLLSRQRRKSISALTEALPQRFTASDRLKEFSPKQSAAVLARYTSGSLAEDLEALGDTFGDLCGRPVAIDRTDGTRVTFANSEVIHLRPSGNAPEFRCYTEAHTAERAKELNQATLALIQSLGPDQRSGR